MTASILRFERRASSQRRTPSTNIDSLSLPSRTARAWRSRELSRLVILVILGTHSSRVLHSVGHARGVRTGFYLCPNRPVVRNVQRPGDAPTINAHAFHENPI